MPPQYVTTTGEIVTVERRIKSLEPIGPKPPLPGLMKWVVNFARAAGGVFKAANIFHLLATNPAAVTVTNMAALLTQLISKWHTRMGPLINGNLADASHELVALDGSGLQTVAFPSSGITGGTSALPDNCALVLSWITTAYWRGGKFRTYMPGVLQTNCTPPFFDTITPTAETAYANAGTGLLNDVGTLSLGSSPVTMGGVSYFHKYAFRTPPVFFSFNGCKVTARIDSQRRRLGKEPLG